MSLPSMRLPLFNIAFPFTLPINTNILLLASCTIDPLKPFPYIQVSTNCCLMATSKLFIASIVISLLLLHLVQAADVVNTDEALGSPAPKMDCGGACSARCRLSSRPRLCKRACGTCCARCNCVPPGTAGNYEVCPCYASLTTHGGRRKCP